MSKQLELFPNSEVRKGSKYSRDNLPKFTEQEINYGIQSGVIKDEEGNIWRYIKSSFNKAEFYCAALHLSFPLFDNEQKPIDPLAKFK